MSQAPQPSPPAVQGTLHGRALRPTVRRLHGVAEGLPESFRRLIEKIAERFFLPGYLMFRIRREAGLTDWDATVFAREIGMGPWHLILLCRVEVALWLLRETSLTVAAIAPLVGYANEGGLRKLFQRMCGVTPAQARRYLRRVPREHRAFGDEALSWSLRVRFHRGEVDAAELGRVLSYLEGRFDPSLQKKFETHRYRI